MIEDYYLQKTDYNKVSGGRLRGILDLLGEVKGKKILDIGCGEGIIGRLLKERGAEVHGADISPLGVEKASKVLDKAFVLDLEKRAELNAVLSNNYDFIIMSEVLEHLFNPETVLRAISGSAPNTKVVISVPNILFWRNRLKIFMGSFEYTKSGLMDRGHIHFFSYKSFVEMMSSEGFKIESSEHHVPTRFLRPFKDIFPGLAAFQFIVRINKR